MNKISINEVKQILEQKIDFDSQTTQMAMNKLGLGQSAFQKISYLEYMTINNSQQDYFSYLHSILEIAKMNFKDKSIDCTEPENIDEIIALLDQRMQQNKKTNNTQPINREKTQERYEKKSRIIKLNHHYQINSITERTLVQQQSPPQNTLISHIPNRIIHKKLTISNNQSITNLYSKSHRLIETSTTEQINQSQRKQISYKNQTIITGIRQRLKDSNCTKQAIDEFMDKIAKIRCVSQQQSIESNRKIQTPAIQLKRQKNSKLITTKLEMMLKKEKLIIYDEPLKVQQLKIGNLMGVIQKVKNQQQQIKNVLKLQQ